MNVSHKNDSINLDWSDFLAQLNISDDGGGRNEANTSNNIAMKPEKIVAIILSVIGVLMNFSSIVAISKVRGRLTSNLR